MPIAIRAGLAVLADLLLYIGATMGALLPIVNPITAAPVFLSVTRGNTKLRRNRQAKMAAIYTCCILLTSLFAGAFVLNFFGITLPVLRIAGGLVVTRVGFGMLEPAANPRVSGAEEEEAQAMDDVALTPVAIPMLSGPGSIATTIALATGTTGLVSYIGVALGIIVVAATAWATLHFSGLIVRVIGGTGMNVLTRLMGLLLICIGITFIATGIVEGLTSEPMLAVERNWLENLRAN
jgi:multiple antibiotic resistance protein